MTKKEIKKLDELASVIFKVKQNWTCEKCERQGHNVNVHHIYSRSNMSIRWDADNIIILCPACHTLSNTSAHKASMEFHDWLIETRGIDWYERLKEKKNIVAKHLNYETIKAYLESL